MGIMNVENFIGSVKVTDNAAFIENTEKRKALHESLKLKSFPKVKDEEWRFTKVDSIFDKAYMIPSIDKDFTIEKYINAKDYAGVVCYKNGFVIKIEVTDLNFIIEPLSKIDNSFDNIFKTQEQVFVELNNYFAVGGVNIVAKKNAIISKPLLILYIIDKDNVISSPRNVINIEGGANVSIEEKILCNSKIESLTNALSYINIEPNATLNYYKIQTGSDICNLFDTTYIKQQADCNLNIFTLSLKGRFLRNNLRIKLDGNGANANMYGLYIPKQNEHVDNLTYIEHAMPNCDSNEMYKGVLNDSSSAVFSGKIMVCKDAQKTKAFQNNKNIVLTNTAKINTKPHLEIYADDVKCSHGATVGQLDEEALFYLRSRGIAKDDAKQLLINSFIDEVVNNISYEPIKDYVKESISQKI